MFKVMVTGCSVVSAEEYGGAVTAIGVQTLDLLATDIHLTVEEARELVGRTFLLGPEVGGK